MKNDDFGATRYQTLVQEATKSRLSMRLLKTKGIHGFVPEMTELYAAKVSHLS